MPGRNGAGPMGYGPRTAWRPGFCTDNPVLQTPSRGFGMGYGRGRSFRGGSGMQRQAGWGGPFARGTLKRSASLLKTRGKPFKTGSTLSSIDVKTFQLGRSSTAESKATLQSRIGT
jgi:hypothetical protein